MDVESLAYLKCPVKIANYLVSIGQRPPSREQIERKLREKHRPLREVGEPRECDGQDFRVAGLVQWRGPNKASRDLRGERRRIAALAALIPDREAPPKPEKPKIGRPCKKHVIPVAAVDLIERVCAELSISEDRFFASRKHGLTFAARSLVVKLLRERNPVAYSFTRLAHIFERKHHTTMLHLEQRFGECCERFPEVAALYEELREAGK